MEVTDLRAAERFVATEPMRGSFGPAQVALLNLSANGVQIEHGNQLRLGSIGRLWFRWDDVAVSVEGVVVWSHLSQKPDESGKLLYRSGVRIQTANKDYPAAIKALYDRKVLDRDVDSLERKAVRLEEREQEKRTGRMILRPFPPAS